MPTGYLEPGERVTVELVADGSGNVATEGDIVEIAGESSNHTQVSVVETAGNGVAVLDREPAEYDPSATYAAGEVVGEAMVFLRGAVEWLAPSDAYTPTVGDLVVGDVGGTVRAYDSAGGDTADLIFGRVWSTNQRGTEYTNGSTAVLRR